MNGSFLFSDARSEEVRCETSMCCGAVSTGNVGTIRAVVENSFELTRFGIFIVSLESVG